MRINEAIITEYSGRTSLSAAVDQYSVTLTRHDLGLTDVKFKLSTSELSQVYALAATVAV